jgi:hypothetical protein
MEIALGAKYHMSNFVVPPARPTVIAAEATIHSILGTSTEEIMIWIGIPYKQENSWICEEHVQGFSQRRVKGETSLQSLANALTVARIDLEGLLTLGYSLTFPSSNSNFENYELLQTTFSVVPFLK